MLHIRITDKSTFFTDFADFYPKIENWPAAEVAHARQTPSKFGLPSLNRNFEDWPAAEVAHARQTPSKLGLPSLNRNFEE